MATRFVHARRALRQAFERGESVPLAAEWQVPAGYVLPRDFSCASYVGLIQCQVLQGEDGTERVLTYWKSREHLRTQQTAFTTATGVAHPRWSADVADIRTGVRSIWPTSIGDFLLKASTLIGALTVVYQAYTFLFDAPEVSVAVDAAQPVDASANGPVLIKLALTNHSTSRPVRLNLAPDDTVDDKGSVRIDYGADYFVLDPGERKESTLTGHTGGPGADRLYLVGHAKSGWLRSTRAVPLSIDVRVWPALRFGRFQPVTPECPGEQCVARAELEVGRSEEGFECWAMLVGEPAVRMRAIRSPSDGGGSVDEVGADDAHLSRIAWHQPGSEPFRRPRIELVFAGTRTAAQWQAIAAKVKWLCDPISIPGA